MFDLTHAQFDADYRQSELLKALASDRLLQTPREDGVSFIDDRPSPVRQVVILVTDALSGIGAAIAAAGRRPHHI